MLVIAIRVQFGLSLRMVSLRKGMMLLMQYVTYFYSQLYEMCVPIWRLPPLVTGMCRLGLRGGKLRRLIKGNRHQCVDGRGGLPQEGDPKFSTM